LNRKSQNRETQFIIDSEFEEKAKKSFYDNYYTEMTDDGIRWRNFGAIEKCKSILELCNGLKINKAVDIGAGPCSILLRLDKIKFASEYYVLEVSPSIVHFIREKISIPRLKAVYLLDTSKTPFDNNFFDLGILSHVLEHVTNPLKLLSETLRICEYVVLEVPLEDCLFANMYWKFIEKITGHKRGDNPIGHINFFNKSSIRKLVKASGGIILKDRTYRLWKTYFFFPSKSQIITMFHLFKSVISYLIFKMTKSRLVSAHYTMLIRQKL